MQQAQSQQVTVGVYEVIRELARGPMSIVYLAHDPRAHRDVALKLLPGEISQDPARRDAFEQLAQDLTRFEYPGIVSVYDFGEHEGQPFLIMPYLAGQPLAEQVRLGPMALLEVARYLEVIAPALGRAHHRGLVHHNLHPGNILFDRDAVPAIADFGLAPLGRPFAEVGGHGVYGNPYYAAPEVADGSGEPPLVDVYALGVMFFHMLAGTPPFQGETPVDTLRAHVEQPIPNLRATRPDLPDSVQGLIIGALAKDPFDRFQQPGEFLDTLMRVVANEIGVSEDELYAASFPPPPSVQPQPIEFSEYDTIPEWYSDQDALVTQAYVSPDDFLSTIPADEPGIGGPTGQETVPYSPVAGPAPGTGGAVIAPQAEERSAGNRRQLRRRERAALGMWRSAQARRAGMNELMVRLAGLTFPPIFQWTLLGVLVAIVALWFQISGALPLITCAVAGVNCPDPSAAIVPTATPAIYPTPLPTVAPDVQTLQGHGQSRISALDYAPSSERFASGAEDNLVIVWDALTGQQVLRLTGHTAPVTDVEFRPDGAQLATSSQDGTAIIWNLDLGTAVRTLSGHAGDIVSVAWSPDGSLLATAGADGRVLVRAASAGGQTVAEINVGVIATNITYAGPDILAIGTEQELILYNIELGAEIRRVDLDGPVLSLALSPDGETLAAGSTDQLALINPQTGTVLDAVTGRTFFDIAWSPDSTRIADASFFSAIVWEVATHATLREYYAEGEDMVTVAWSHDTDEWLVTGSATGTVTVWDYAATPFRGVAGAPQNPPASVSGPITVGAVDAFQQWRWLGGHGDIVRSFAFTPDMTRMFTGAQDGRLFPWNLAAGRTRPALNRESGFVRWITTVALRPQGDVLVSTGSRTALLEVWDATTGTQLTTLSGQGTETTTAAWSPDGSRLVAGGSDGSLIVWSYNEEDQTFSQEQVIGVHRTPVTALAFSPDGSRLASGEQNETGTVIIVDVASGDPLGDPMALGAPAVDLAWLPAQLLAAASGSRLVLLDPNSGIEQVSFDNPTGQPVTQVDWSADATLLAAGTLGGRLRLFDANLGERGTYTLEGDHGPLSALQFSPDGTVLATGYSDGLIVLWGVLE